MEKGAGIDPTTVSLFIRMFRHLLSYCLFHLVTENAIIRKPLSLLVSAREKLLSYHLWNDTTKSMSVALFYGCCSVSMNFLNKLIVTSFDFNFPFFIMICQMCVSVIVLDVLRGCGIISLPSYSLREGKDFIVTSLCFAMHSTLSLLALHGMNIPMYGAIKRCTPLVSLALSVVLLKKSWPSRLCVISILIITFGCLVASMGDLQFDRYSYLMGTLSVFAQGSYLTLVQKASETKKSTIEMIHINGYNTLPFFVVCSLLASEPAGIVGAPCLSDANFYVSFALVVSWGSILTFSQFLCASVCSALTTSLVGVAKSVIQTSIGFFTFGGVQYDPLNVLGLILNFIGAFLYTYVKYNEGKSKGLMKDKNRSMIITNGPKSGVDVNDVTDDVIHYQDGELTTSRFKREHAVQFRIDDESEENLTHQL